MVWMDGWDFQTKKPQKKYTYEVGILQLIPNRNVIEFDIEVLIDRFQRSGYADVVFELDCYGVVD